MNYSIGTLCQHYAPCIFCYITKVFYWYIVSILCAVPFCYITKNAITHDLKSVRGVIVWAIWLSFCAIDITFILVAFLHSILFRAPYILLTSYVCNTSSADAEEQAESHKVHIVICGYSFAGFEVHKLLQNNPSLQHCTFTIIEPKDYFEFTPSILAAMTKPSKYRSISFPLSDCFDSNRSTLIRGKATCISSNFLTVLMRDESTSTISFDFCFICTGSKYAAPIKVNVYPTVDEDANYQQREQGMNDIYNKLTDDQSVGIIGGGPVGVELAAEIAQEFPSKHITIMDLAPHLCSNFPMKTQRYIEEWCRKRSNISLKLDTYIRHHIAPSGITDKHRVMVSDSLHSLEQEMLQFDTVYLCAGFQPNTELFSAHDSDASFASCLSDKYKFIQVDDWMRVATGEHPNIFAVGDVLQQPHINEVKLAHTAEIHAIYLNKLMAYLMDNGDDEKVTAESFQPYHEWLLGEKLIPNKKWNMPLVYTISLGEMEGSMGFGAICLNGFVTQIFKWLIEVSLCSLYHRAGVFDINIYILDKRVLLFRFYQIGYRVFSAFWWFCHHFTRWYIRRFNQN